MDLGREAITGLKSKARRFETRALYCGVSVCVGVGIEIFSHFIHGYWAVPVDVVGGSIVFIGIALELWLGSVASGANDQIHEINDEEIKRLLNAFTQAKLEKSFGQNNG